VVTARGKRPRVVRAATVIAVTIVVGGACSANDTPHRSIAQKSPVVATPAPAALCTANSVHALVLGFVAAFNAGNQRKLQRLWAQSGNSWAWYSTDAPGARVRNVAADRAGLGAYFAQRHKHAETLRLTSFQYNGVSGALGGFEYTLIRKADDLPATAYGGKGDAVCWLRPLTIGTWSMARTTRQ